MKILFITNELSRSNGWSTEAYELHNQWKGKHDITFITNNGSSSNPTNNSTNINLISSESYYNPITLFKDYKIISKRLKNNSFDIIFCNVEPYLPLASLLKRKLAIKKLILVGNGTYIYFPYMRPPKKYFNHFFIKSVDLIISISDFTLNKINEWYKKKTCVVGLGVDTNHHYPIKGLKKEKAFIYVGSQKKRKGIDYLLIAFEKLIKSHPDAKLYLVGSKNKEYIEFVNKIHLRESVIFTGRISHEELLKYFSMSMCHVLPSVNTNNAFEGYGLVHIEANACGIPSIGSKGTANDEVIINGKTGFLCKQKNIDDIYKKMKLILEDKKLYNELCKNSLSYAKKHSWKKTADNMMKEIKKLN